MKWWRFALVLSMVEWEARTNSAGVTINNDAFDTSGSVFVLGPDSIVARAALLEEVAEGYFLSDAGSYFVRTK